MVLIKLNREMLCSLYMDVSKLASPDLKSGVETHITCRSLHEKSTAEIVSTGKITLLPAYLIF